MQIQQKYVGIFKGYEKNWYKSTPENFRFTAKLPKVITHDKRLSNIDEEAARREVTEAADALTQVTTRSRDYTDAVQSSLSEWAHGQSESSTTGVAGGLGFALGPVVIGGGAAHGRSVLWIDN